MRKQLLLGFTLLLINFSFSQRFETPIASTSFGLNSHTNRDIGMFSHIGSNGNTYIIGTTEKDSTFNDIITVKLDNNQNEVWKRKFSVPTNRSYDVPEKTFLSENNELYIVGRSSYKTSNANGLIFILKYDQNGNLLFNKTIGNIDGSDYVAYGYMNAELNDDGTLNLVYAPFDFTTYDSELFKFLKVDNSGNIIDSFEKEIPNRGVTGLINDGTYYLFTKKLIDEVNYLYNYEFHKITSSINQSTIEISDGPFVNYFNSAVLSDNVYMTLDSNENIFLACPNEVGGQFDPFYTRTFQVAKINDTVGLEYVVSTSESDDYYLIDTFLNEENEHIVVANNLNDNSTELLTVDDINEIQTTATKEDFLATGLISNDDGSFYLTTSNSNVNLFSHDLNFIRSFNTSNSFSLANVTKVDNNNLIAMGTRFEKMFPESDYQTQLDIIVEKISESNVTESYEYSGIGTSRAFQQRVIIDNENNYLVLVTEKMGPEYLGIGGTNPPLNKRIIKYDSDLNKIWESDVPEHIFNLVNHSGRDIDFFIDDFNNLYLNLPRAGNNYGLGYDLYKVDANGNFEFVNATYVADKFHANHTSIFMAENYFLFEDSSVLHVLDKENGNLIQDIDVGHEEFLDIFSIGNDYYFYTYEEVTNNTPDFLYLYKNGVKLFTRNLSNNYGIYQYEIDDEGTLFFATENGSDRRINKLDINNSYSYYNTSDDISRFKMFNDGNIFIYLDDYSTIILDHNLNFISNGDPINSSNPYLMTWDNYILFGTSFENSVRIINKDGEIIDYFTIEGFLHNWYSQFDNDGNLIVVGEFGDRIHTFNEYSWFRGFIHNYGQLNNVLSVDDYNDSGLSENSIKVYPNPSKDIFNIKTLNDSFIDRINVFDITGKLVSTYGNVNSIDLQNYMPGIYFLKVFSDNTSYATKVIKN